MNDLFIDFSNKEPYQFLNQTFPKKKINSITSLMLWMPFQIINKQTKLMMMREFVEMRANNDPHFPHRISNEPPCSKLDLCLTLLPGTIPSSYICAIITVLCFLRHFFVINLLNKTF